MTIAQTARVAGFKASLRVRGRTLTATPEGSVTGLVEDVAAITDPDQNAKAKTALYVNVHALVGGVASPRTVTSFTDGTRTFTVIRFEESPAGEVVDKWFCEASRT